MNEKRDCRHPPCDRSADPNKAGWCSMHYQRVRRGVDMDMPPRRIGGGRPREPLSERFWKYVKPAGDGCWNWTGSLKPNGYGQIADDWPTGRVLYAHRVSFDLHYGGIPAGLEVDHICENKRCVNPIHLEAVTHAENVRRSRIAV